MMYSIFPLLTSVKKMYGILCCFFFFKVHARCGSTEFKVISELHRKLKTRCLEYMLGLKLKKKKSQKGGKNQIYANHEAIISEIPVIGRLR